MLRAIMLYVRVVQNRPEFGTGHRQHIGHIVGSTGLQGLEPHDQHVKQRQKGSYRQSNFHMED